MNFPSLLLLTTFAGSASALETPQACVERIVYDTDGDAPTFSAQESTEDLVERFVASKTLSQIRAGMEACLGPSNTSVPEPFSKFSETFGHDLQYVRSAIRAQDHVCLITAEIYYIQRTKKGTHGLRPEDRNSHAQYIIESVVCTAPPQVET